ncbi:MAG: hypothetical protein H6R07_2159 [Proteobacteria bacterium]|nr:hypothetical protein [Pseudomonadota bacterium]
MKHAAAILTLLLAVAVPAPAEDFSFDAKEFEKKTFEFGGYLEAKQEALNQRPDRSSYALTYPNEASRNWLYRSTGTLELTGKLNLDQVVADLRLRGLYAEDTFVRTIETDKVMEGGVRWSPQQGLSFDAGKRVMRWGKGYAWSPVGFVERAKDPSDPQASREGFVMASMDWTRTFDGPISTVGFTPLIVPVKDKINGDFGKPDHINPAAKLYLLAWDTDVDLMWQGKGSKPQSFGVDFSRNLGTNLEIHGEWARMADVQRSYVDGAGNTFSRTENINSFLAGLRYLTENEVTWIAEYYRNGSGYSSIQLEDYYRFADQATAPGASASLFNKAKNLAQSGYARSNPGRDYLYLRASVSEPFNWLYTTTALTTMVNLNDGSFQITPEISYTGFTNMEIRARAIFLSNQRHTDFGEKTSSQRYEVYARYFF